MLSPVERFSTGVHVLLRRLIILSSGTLLLGLIAFGGIEYLGQSRVDPLVEDYRGIQEKHLQAFLEDQDFLSGLEWLKRPSETAADAGSQLNRRLRWTPDEGREKSQAQAGVPAKVAEQILRMKGDWLRQHERIFKNFTPDLSALSGLEKFDRWDIESSEQIQNLMTTKDFILPEKMPVPETLDLMTLAKLRLAVGARDQQPVLALQDVRHLARLLLTTENIHLITSGLSILDTERRAHRYFVQAGILAETDWTPISRSVTRRASRAIWGARGYFQLWTDPEIFKRVFLGNKLPFGFCAVVNEAAPKVLSLRPLLKPQLPFERNFRLPFSLIDQTLSRAKESCRIRYLRAKIDAQQIRRADSAPVFLATLPYSRKVFGLRMATIPFIGFEGYEDKPAP